jgi:hypothetical protein
MKLTRHLLLLPLLSFAADTWQSFAVDGLVTVQLPSQPTELDVAKLAPGRNMRGTRVWLVQAPEGFYQVIRTAGGTHITRADTTGRRFFYKGVAYSIVHNRQGQLLSSTPFSTAGGAGMEFKYRGIHQGTGKRVISYTRSLVLDSITYALNFIPTDKTDSLGLAGAEQRRRFFNSIMVKP